MHPQRDLIEAAERVVEQFIDGDLKNEMLHKISVYHDMPPAIVKKRFEKTEFRTPQEVAHSFLDKFNIPHGPEHRAHLARFANYIHTELGGEVDQNPTGKDVIGRIGF